MPPATGGRYRPPTPSSRTDWRPHSAPTSPRLPTSAIRCGRRTLSNQWYSWTGSGWSAGNDPAGPNSDSNPPRHQLPTPTPTPTASPNDTVVHAGSTGAITDAASNHWTISSGNAVLENGQAAAFSANVAEIAYVSKTVWQENTNNQWYSWTGSGWSAGNDPLPVATPTPTPPPHRRQPRPCRPTTPSCSPARRPRSPMPPPTAGRYRPAPRSWRTDRRPPSPPTSPRSPTSARRCGRRTPLINGQRDRVRMERRQDPLLLSTPTPDCNRRQPQHVSPNDTVLRAGSTAATPTPPATTGTDTVRQHRPGAHRRPTFSERRETPSRKTVRRTPIQSTPDGQDGARPRLVVLPRPPANPMHAHYCQPPGRLINMVRVTIPWRLIPIPTTFAAAVSLRYSTRHRRRVQRFHQLDWPKRRCARVIHQAVN